MPIWPFGRKSAKTPTETAELYPSVQRYLKETGGQLQLHADPVLDEHFRLSQLLESSPASRQMEIAERMVAMSVVARASFKATNWKTLPSHRGFYRLAVNLERDKQYQEAIQICRRAKREGWMGDWDKRTERCQSKLEKLTD